LPAERYHPIAERRFDGGAARVSIGWTTSEAEIERFLGAWRKLATALSKGHSIAV